MGIFKISLRRSLSLFDCGLSICWSIHPGRRISSMVQNPSRSFSSQAQLPRKKMIIDCDAGPDDASAIMMALAQPHVDVVAVTTVMGNASVESTTTNVLRVLNLCGRLDIPVYKGCSLSLLGKQNLGNGYCGNDGLGDVTDAYPPPSGECVQQEHASIALSRLAKTFSGDLSLVCTGPLTNVALAANLDPSLSENLKEVFIMGGNYKGKGTMGLCQEFNFTNDPEAAYKVLDCLRHKSTILPMECCYEHPLSLEWYNKLTSIGTKKSNFVKRTERILVEKTKSEDTNSMYAWDQLAMSVAIDESVAIETVTRDVTVELCGNVSRGMMAVDWQGMLGRKGKARIVTRLDLQKYTVYMEQALLDWESIH